MRNFLKIWAGQLVSLVGSHLTGFAIGIWVYEQSRSVTLFGVTALLAEFPGLLLSPFAGALVDRWDRRWTLILSDVGGALCSVALCLLTWSGHLALWHVYVLMVAASIYGAFQVPAYSATVTLLVRKEDLGRAGGMTEMSMAASQLLAPALGGALLGLIRFRGVVLVDFLSFCFALLTLSISRIPKAPPSRDGLAARGSLWKEAAFGWHFVRARPVLLELLLFQAVVNFLLGFVMVLGTPMALQFMSAPKLGALLSVGGLGMLAGSLVMTAWGGPRRLVWGILGGQLVGGLAVFGGGLRPDPALFGICLFAFLFASPIVTACAQTIWQRKVPADVQGKVFAVRRLIGWVGAPLAYLLAGPLSDRVFEPLMAPGGRLAPVAGRLLGIGPGRGIALLFMLVGVLMVFTTLWAAATRLRNLEDDLPDVALEDLPEASAGEPSIASS